MTVGEVIKENAKKAGITLRELAKKCHITEVSMIRYANDERIPKGPEVANIANALGIDVNEILKADIKKRMRHPDSPVDGPMDGVMMETDCIRTDFLENPGEGETSFQQREKSQAHISASVEIGIMSVRDMATGVMLTVSLTDAMEVMKAALDASKGGSSCTKITSDSAEAADAE